MSTEFFGYQELNVLDWIVLEADGLHAMVSLGQSKHCHIIKVFVSVVWME